MNLNKLDLNTSLHNFTAFLLAAGVGSRLKPLTDYWPKCLMPINGEPLMALWLSMLMNCGCERVLVNTCHHADKVEQFLQNKKYQNWVEPLFEPHLLGTAGTLLKNYKKIQGKTILLIHADNLCDCDIRKFIAYHYAGDLETHPITMMTFTTDNPQSCGIVDLNLDGIVLNMQEKKTGIDGRTANAAIYLIEPEVTDWIYKQENVSDFTLEVLPMFYGRIRTWHNNGILRDIGTIGALRSVQKEDAELSSSYGDKEWGINFIKNLSNIKISSD